MGVIDKTVLPDGGDIAAAVKRLAGVAVRTPLINAPVLDDLLGARVFLKAETLQRTGSFKFRGAYNKVASIPLDKRAAGVVAYSSGNHAQGVAAAAKLLGMRATIVMPGDAPLAKRNRTAGARRRDRALRPQHARPRRDRQGDRGRTRRHAGAAL